jgi:two-component system chemotaxis sensor kinase CheA
VLLAKVAMLSVAIPITNILHTMELPRSMISTLEKRKVFYQEGEAIPILSLNRFFDLPYASAENEFLPLFITEIKGSRVALAVDRFLGQQEVFVKPLGRPMAKLKGLAGGAILGDGEMVFILDVANLL